MVAEKTFNSEAFKFILNSEKNNNGAPFTVRSKETGKDFTFKISRNEWNGNRFTHVKVEVGYMEFKYLGHYRNGALNRKGQIIDSTSAKAISWILRNIEQENFEKVDELVEFFHLGKCVKCGKDLTDATSIEIGLGPICRAQ